MNDLERYEFWHQETDEYIDLLVEKRSGMNDILDVVGTKKDTGIIKRLFEKIDLINNRLRLILC